jgi:hypothetical protein
MARIGHSIEEFLEAGNAADILGRGTAVAINEARIVKLRIGSGDALGGYGMPPIVAEIVGVRECTDAAFD